VNPAPPDIRRARAGDFPAIWRIFHAVVASGDSYAYAPTTTEDDARRVWTGAPAVAYVALLDGAVVGTYSMRPNQPVLGDHVANCGYMTAPQARGRGVATAMCAHSLDAARGAGYAAMQFNCVVATNLVAIRLWRRHGFVVVGTVPRAFRHATLGPTDVLVMHRFLQPQP
jgi:L-amino acid N-acyltransferase YncA